VLAKGMVLYYLRVHLFSETRIRHFKNTTKFREIGEIKKYSKCSFGGPISEHCPKVVS